MTEQDLAAAALQGLSVDAACSFCPGTHKPNGLTYADLWDPPLDSRGPADQDSNVLVWECHHCGSYSFRDFAGRVVNMKNGEWQWHD